MMSRAATAVTALVLGVSLLSAPAAGARPTTPTPPPGQAHTTTPITHFIFMMQGDRSFDNYFGTYPGADGIPAETCQKRIVTGPATGCVKPFPLHGKVPPMLGAGAEELHKQYDNGAMDGFVAAYQDEGRDGTNTMGYYDQRDLPTYWDLAARYALFDHFFSSTNDGVRANRSYWVAGKAAPAGGPQQLNAAYSKEPTIFDRLQAANISWKFYVQSYDPNQTFRTNSRTNPTTQPVRVPLLNYARFVDNPALNAHITDMSQYYKDLDAGTLPAVAYVASSGPSERSARSITSGQKLVSDLVGSLMVSKYWDSSAFLLSYDGSGGWYDHVKPPQVDRNGYGMRVPALLVSPYARRGHIENTVMDYTSALAFIEKNWQLAPLATRDAAANSIAPAFDFHASPRLPQVNFGQPAAAKSPLVSVALVYFCYGAALLLVLGLVLFAIAAPAWRRRQGNAGEPAVRDAETVGAQP
jgi:phospholipase C